MLADQHYGSDLFKFQQIMNHREDVEEIMMVTVKPYRQWLQHQIDARKPKVNQQIDDLTNSVTWIIKHGTTWHELDWRRTQICSGIDVHSSKSYVRADK